MGNRKLTISILIFTLSLFIQGCGNVKYLEHKADDINSGLGAETDTLDTDGDGLLDSKEIELGTDPKKADTDGDGLNDGEEINTHGTDPTKLDTDGGGVNDGEEIVNGTNPVDDPSDDTSVSSVDSDNDGLTDDEEVTHGTDPDDSDSDDDGLSDGDEVNNHSTDPNNNDSDNDGLSDGDEVNTHGTDPTVADTDEGGVNDGNEVANGTNPVDDPTDDVSTALDSDNDGLTDEEEATFGTDPNKPDTDDDGLTDSEEVNTHNTDPLDDDTDNDNLKDGEEIAVHNTDPLNADTDGGGANDGAEVAAGTNPVDQPQDDQVCREVDTLMAWKDNGDKHEMVPYAGEFTAKDNYNYYSWSAHPKVGPAPENDTLIVYLYNGPNGTSLFYIAGKDDNNLDRVWETVHLNININSSSNDLQILENDDNNETKKVNNNLFKARMVYTQNSDGGVIGNFSTEGLKIKIDILKATHISKIILAGSNHRQVFNVNASTASGATLNIESAKVSRCEGLN